MSQVQGIALIILVALVLFTVLFRVRFAGQGQIFENFLSLERSKAAKGVFALLILLHHLSIEIHDAGVLEAFSNIGYLAVSIFFFFSGFGLLKSVREKEGYLRGFLLRRLPEILVPFWLTNLLYIAVYLFGNVKMSALDAVLYFLGGKLINDYAWFILIIALFYVVFYLLFRFLSESKAFWGMGIFTLLLIVLCMAFRVDNWWYNSCIALFVGMAFARNETAVTAFFSRKTWLKLTGFIVLFLVGFSAAPRIIEASGLSFASDLRTAVQIVTVVFFLLVFIPLRMKVRIQNRWLLLIGNAALEIYLIQRLVLVSLKPLHVFSLRPMTWIQAQPALYAAFTIVISVLLGLALHTLFQLILKQFRKIRVR